MIIRSRSTAAIMNNYNEIEKDISTSPNASSSTGNYKSPPGGARLWKYLTWILVASALLYMTLFAISPTELKEHRNAQSASYEQLTIVMNTFKRHDMMMDAVDFYSQCELVKYIYVVW